jgi:hypothetical protein
MIDPAFLIGVLGIEIAAIEMAAISIAGLYPYLRGGFRWIRQPIDDPQQLPLKGHLGAVGAASEVEPIAILGRPHLGTMISPKPL